MRCPAATLYTRPARASSAASPRGRPALRCAGHARSSPPCARGGSPPPPAGAATRDARSQPCAFRATAGCSPAGEVAGELFEPRPAHVRARGASVFVAACWATHEFSRLVYIQIHFSRNNSCCSKPTIGSAPGRLRSGKMKFFLTHRWKELDANIPSSNRSSVSLRTQSLIPPYSCC